MILDGRMEVNDPSSERHLRPWRAEGTGFLPEVVSLFGSDKFDAPRSLPRRCSRSGGLWEPVRRNRCPDVSH